MHMAAEVVRVKDRLDVLEAMAGEGRELRHRRLGERQTYDSRSSQIVKRQAIDAGAGAGLGPGGSKAVRRPGTAIGIRQDQGAATFGAVEKRSQWSSGGHRHAPACLAPAKS